MKTKKINFKNYMTEPITISSAKVRTCWGEILDKARYTHQPYLVTKKAQPAAVILGADDYEALLDLLEIMGEQLDPEFQASLWESKKEIAEGRGIPFDDLKAMLNIK